MDIMKKYGRSSGLDMSGFDDFDQNEKKRNPQPKEELFSRLDDFDQNEKRRNPQRKDDLLSGFEKFSEDSPRLKHEKKYLEKDQKNSEENLEKDKKSSEEKEKNKNILLASEEKKINGMNSDLNSKVRNQPIGKSQSPVKDKNQKNEESYEIKGFQINEGKRGKNEIVNNERVNNEKVKTGSRPAKKHNDIKIPSQEEVTYYLNDVLQDFVDNILKKIARKEQFLKDLIDIYIESFIGFIFEGILYDFVLLETTLNELPDIVIDGLVNVVFSDYLIEYLQIEDQIIEELFEHMEHEFVSLIIDNDLKKYIEFENQQIEGLFPHLIEDFYHSMINDVIFELLQSEIINQITNFLFETWNIKSSDDSKMILNGINLHENPEISLILEQVNKYAGSINNSVSDDYNCAKENIFKGVMEKIYSIFPDLLQEKLKLCDKLNDKLYKTNEKLNKRKSKQKDTIKKMKEFKEFECSVEGGRSLMITEHYIQNNQKLIQNMHQNLERSLFKLDIWSLEDEFKNILDS